LKEEKSPHFQGGDLGEVDIISAIFQNFNFDKIK